MFFYLNLANRSPRGQAIIHRYSSYTNLKDTYSKRRLLFRMSIPALLPHDYVLFEREQVREVITENFRN